MNDSLEMDGVDAERRIGKYPAMPWACELVQREDETNGREFITLITKGRTGES